MWVKLIKTFFLRVEKGGVKTYNEIVSSAESVIAPIKQLYIVMVYNKSVREVFENEKPRTEKFRVLDSRESEKSRSDIYHFSTSRTSRDLDYRVREYFSLINLDLSTRIIGSCTILVYNFRFSQHFY